MRFPSRSQQLKALQLSGPNQEHGTHLMHLHSPGGAAVMLLDAAGAEMVMGHFFKTQPNPQKSSPDPTLPIIDTWCGILGYTDNFIQQLLHVTDEFTVRS